MDFSQLVNMSTMVVKLAKVTLVGNLAMVVTVCKETIYMVLVRNSVKINYVNVNVTHQVNRLFFINKFIEQCI